MEKGETHPNRTVCKERSFCLELPRFALRIAGPSKLKMFLFSPLLSPWHLLEYSAYPCNRHLQESRSFQRGRCRRGRSAISHAIVCPCPKRMRRKNEKKKRRKRSETKKSKAKRIKRRKFPPTPSTPTPLRTSRIREKNDQNWPSSLEPVDHSQESPRPSGPETPKPRNPETTRKIFLLPQESGKKLSKISFRHLFETVPRLSQTLGGFQGRRPWETLFQTF